jgi:hypothetical protein
LVNTLWKQKNPEKYQDYLRKIRERYATDEKYRRKVLDISIKSAKKNKNSPKYKARKARWRETHKEYISKTAKALRENLKFSVFAIYSEGQPKCACCGETIIEFLSVDHIKGKGMRYGKDKRLQTNYELFRWIIRHHFPKCFRVLCRNCNSSLGQYGYCPHEWIP